jgi:hypothetical protein
VAADFREPLRVSCQQVESVRPRIRSEKIIN